MSDEIDAPIVAANAQNRICMVPAESRFTPNERTSTKASGASATSQRSGEVNSVTPSCVMSSWLLIAPTPAPGLVKLSENTA